MGGDLLCLLLLGFLIGCVFIFAHFDLVLIRLVLGNIVFIIIFDFHHRSRGGAKVDGVCDEFRIVRHQIFQTISVSIFQAVLLEMKDNFRTTLEAVAAWIGKDMEIVLTVDRLPHILGVRSRVLGSHADSFGNKKGGVESDSKLSNHARGIRVSLFRKGFEETGRSAPGDGPKVLHQVVMSHTDSSVADCDGLGVGIVFDTNFQFILVLHQIGLCQGREAHLVEGIRSVGDELTQKDIFVLVERVHHDIQHAVHLCLELEVLGIAGRSVRSGFLHGIFWCGGGFVCADKTLLSRESANGEQNRSKGQSVEAHC
mmetsp:Transcript_21992/g.50756  ORF Transcript_21992/g.50756 Transcript_21992/m.50756 type:complete len:313 (+) Transcript_21992:1581-2519(+)